MQRVSFPKHRGVRHSKLTLKGCKKGRGVKAIEEHERQGGDVGSFGAKKGHKWSYMCSSRHRWCKLTLKGFRQSRGMKLEW